MNLWNIDLLPSGLINLGDKKPSSYTEEMQPPAVDLDAMTILANTQLEAEYMERYYNRLVISRRQRC
jgi:hypothetical protein